MLDSKYISFDPKLDKDDCKEKITELHGELCELTQQLHIEKKHGVLVVLQGLDASGKDGIVMRCFSGLSPRFTQVASFKKPTAEEASHDYLWRIHQEIPPRGVIGIFNRSHYEDILVPESYGWIDKKEVENRYKSNTEFEEHLKRCNIHTLKFFLNISYDLQGEKLDERKFNPLKRYKHQDSDFETRARWDDFMKSYDGILKNCNKPYPWINVPADKKWQKDFVVLDNTVNLLKKLV